MPDSATDSTKVETYNAETKHRHRPIAPVVGVWDALVVAVNAPQYPIRPSNTFQ
jgi:hypothetical protein